MNFLFFYLVLAQNTFIPLFFNAHWYIIWIYIDSWTFHIKQNKLSFAVSDVKTIESRRNCMTQKSIIFFVVHEPFDSIGSVYLCVLLCADIRKLICAKNEKMKNVLNAIWWIEDISAFSHCIMPVEKMKKRKEIL